MIRWFFFAIIARVLCKMLMVVCDDSDKDFVVVTSGSIAILSYFSSIAFMIVGIVKVLSNFGIYW